MPSNLLGLLLLMHLAGVFRQPQMQHAPMPARPAPKPKPQQTISVGGPSAQGSYGISQGFHGSYAPMRGGVPSMRNTAGLYQHQMNPFSVMAGVR